VRSSSAALTVSRFKHVGSGQDDIPQVSVHRVRISLQDAELNGVAALGCFHPSHSGGGHAKSLRDVTGAESAGLPYFCKPARRRSMRPMNALSPTAPLLNDSTTVGLITPGPRGVLKVRHNHIMTRG
jgi:hypothetical protein